MRPGRLGSSTRAFFTIGRLANVRLDQSMTRETLFSSTPSYTLASNVENLKLLGNSGIDGLGNSLDNWIKGNSGDNHLYSYDGADRLTSGVGNNTVSGGSGADRFGIDSLVGADVLTDFGSGLDKVVVEATSIPIGDGDSGVEGATTVSGPGGFSAAAELVVVTNDISGGQAADADGTVNAAELTLLAQLASTGTTTVNDYLFGTA